jgi:hypothetical protein
MQKDHKLLLVIEVEFGVNLLEFDQIHTWMEKIQFAWLLKHKGREACLF